ncbi:hypothetical protein HanIR_Chr04g0155091 [Helianthus annuus]|nr:hypothetical protein HanIR_Chr04g0155091 [Helianthus annuus]
MKTFRLVGSVYLWEKAGEGGRIQEQVSLKCKNKTYRVWIEEEITDWTPDSVGPVVIPGDKSSCSDSAGSEDRSVGIPNTGSDGPAGNLVVAQLEDQELENVTLRPKEVNVGNLVGKDKCGPGNNCLGNCLSDTCNIGEEGNISISGGPPKQANVNDILFFSSVDKERSNKKGTFKCKPRNKAKVSLGMNSPNSIERSKKRSRDIGSFGFDLNLASNEVFGDIPVQVNLVSQDGNGDSGGESAGLYPDEVVPESSGLADVGEGLVCHPVSPDFDIADTFDSQQEDELEATLNIGKVVGVRFQNHKALVKAAINGEGNNVVLQ